MWGSRTGNSREIKDALTQVDTSLTLFLLLAPAWAQKEEKKRSAEAHEHGSGKLGLAFEGLQGRFEWKIPLESLVGFEYKPKTPQDTKKLSDALDIVRKKFGEMVMLPPKAACRIETARADTRFEDHGDHTHSDFEADGKIVCQQPPVGEIRFAFRTYFPGVHKTSVQFLSDSVQAGAEIVDDAGVLMIGKK